MYCTTTYSRVSSSVSPSSSSSSSSSSSTAATYAFEDGRSVWYERKYSIMLPSAAMIHKRYMWVHNDNMAAISPSAGGSSATALQSLKAVQAVLDSHQVSSCVTIDFVFWILTNKMLHVIAFVLFVVIGLPQSSIFTVCSLYGSSPACLGWCSSVTQRVTQQQSFLYSSSIERRWHTLFKSGGQCVEFGCKWLVALFVSQGNYR